MTMNDNWLIERARKVQGVRKNRPLLKAQPPVDDLWSQLQRETARQIKFYTDALGDPGALVIKTPPDAIEVSRPDGRQMTLRVDRDRRMLFQTVVDSAGAVRKPRPIIHFATTASGELTFNFGGVHGAAASILRRMI